MIQMWTKTNSEGLGALPRHVSAIKCSPIVRVSINLLYNFSPTDACVYWSVICEAGTALCYVRAYLRAAYHAWTHVRACIVNASGSNYDATPSKLSICMLCACHWSDSTVECLLQRRRTRVVCVRAYNNQWAIVGARDRLGAYSQGRSVPYARTSSCASISIWQFKNNSNMNTGVARIFVGGHPADAAKPASAVHTCEAVAGSWGSVSTPAVGRVMDGALERSENSKKLGEMTFGGGFL